MKSGTVLPFLSKTAKLFSDEALTDFCSWQLEYRRFLFSGEIIIVRAHSVGLYNRELIVKIDVDGKVFPLDLNVFYGCFYLT